MKAKRRPARARKSFDIVRIEGGEAKRYRMTVPSFPMSRLEGKMDRERFLSAHAPQAQARYHAFSMLLATMKPDDFIDVVPEGWNVLERVREDIRDWKRGTYRSPYAHLYKRISNREYTDPPNLWITPECQVLAHEGRHRAAVSHVAGLRHMPVIWNCRRGNDIHNPYEPLSWKECFKCIGKPLKKQYEPMYGQYGTQNVAYK